MSTLQALVQKHPFTAYQTWWELGPKWADFMSDAIGQEWQRLSASDYDNQLAQVKSDVAHYTETVYQCKERPDLVDSFIDKSLSQPLQSGEFDALSYSFYKSAFTLLEKESIRGAESLNDARRNFTRKTGHSFFKQLHTHLNLETPTQLNTAQDVAKLKQSIQQIGDFLHQQGYLRDHFAFTFDVAVEHQGQVIKQQDAQFIDNLNQHGKAYALYEMGYPAILPSAVYLYHGIGEAQHHSSRIIEDLFAFMGCQACETDDFDPVGYPADQVVELWEIQRS